MKLYLKNDANQEENVQKIRPGEVFIATNLAGRGTDIDAHEVERTGGLHVCLTFIPTSVRVEEQAFGRTSRQGRMGSGQMIYFSKVNSEERNRLEDEKLKNFLNNDLKVMKTKDNCFRRFCRIFTGFREKLKQRERSKRIFFKSSQLQIKELCILQSIEERWALFLKLLDDGTVPISAALQHYTLFKTLLSTRFKQEDGTKVINNPFYHCSIGNHFLEKNKVNDAVQHFTQATKIDSDFASAAYLGLGYCSLKTVDVNYKCQAISHFKTALTLFQDESSKHLAATSYLQERLGADAPLTDLYKQLSCKLNILGSVSNCANAALSVTRESLRAVDIVVKNKGGNQQQILYPFKQDAVQSAVLNTISKQSDSASFNLTFNSLTGSTSDGTNDQAYETLNAVAGKPFGIVIKRASIDDLRTLLLPHKYLTTVGQSEALQAITSWESSEKTILSTIGLGDSKGNLDVYTFPAQSAAKMQDKLTSINYTQAKKHILLCDASTIFHLVQKEGNKENSDLFKAIQVSVTVDNLSRAKALKLVQLFGDHCQKFTISFLGSFPDAIPYILRLGANCATFTVNGDRIISSYHDKLQDINETILSFDKSQLQQAIELITAFPEETSFNISLESMKKDFISPTLHTVDDNNSTNALMGQFTLQLTENKNQVNRKKFVECIRKNGYKFSLEFPNLNKKDAQQLIRNANMSTEKMQQKSTKQIAHLFTSEWLPVVELLEFNTRGIQFLYEFNERLFVPWSSVACLFALASIQAAVGVALICTGFGSSLGLSFITEGASDLFVAYRAYSSCQFRWEDYAKQKAVSLTLSACSMGLSALKDSAKGASLLINKVGEEFAEQAATRVLVKSTGIKVTQKTLKSLACKQVAVAVGEAAGREGLNHLVGMGIEYAMSSMRPQLCETVGKLVKASFQNSQLDALLRLWWALDTISGRERLQAKVQNVINQVTNPQSNFWTANWNSIGLPLCQGVLSDPKYLGSKFSWAIRLTTILHGMKEIYTVVEQVEKAIIKELSKDVLSSTCFLLHSECKIKIEDAQDLADADVLSRKTVQGQAYFSYEINPSCSLFESQKELVKSKILPFLTTLNKFQSNFQLKDVDSIVQNVTSSITDHVIQIADTQMMKPISTWAVGSLVSQLSSELQRQLSSDGLTIVEAIHQEADKFKKQYLINEKQEEIIAGVQNAMNTKRKNGQEVPEAVEKRAIAIASGAPASLAEMTMMAEAYGIDLLIVTEDYQLTKEDLKSGRKIVKFAAGEKDAVTGEIGEGHWSYYNETSGAFVDGVSTGKDCGYAVIAGFTGVDAAVLRKEMAQTLASNPSGFQQVMKNEQWIVRHHPMEARMHLMVGAKSKPPERKRVL